MRDFPGTAYIRVRSDSGQMENKEFETLTDSEVDRALELADKDRVVQWVKYLCDQVRWRNEFLESEGYTSEAPNE